MSAWRPVEYQVHRRTLFAATSSALGLSGWVEMISDAQRRRVHVEQLLLHPGVLPHRVSTGLPEIDVDLDGCEQASGDRVQPPNVRGQLADRVREQRNLNPVEFVHGVILSRLARWIKPRRRAT